MMRVSKLIQVFFIAILVSGCNALQVEIITDINEVNALPESMARDFLLDFNKVGKLKTKKKTQLHACKFREKKLNGTPYEDVSFTFYDRSLNVLTLIVGYQYKIITNTGCVIASNDRPKLDKLATALISLGGHNETVWEHF